MNKITEILLKLINKIPEKQRNLISTDKWLHLFYGMLISLTVTIFTQNPILGFSIASLAGLIKEGKDYYINKKTTIKTHSVELKDFLYTALGGLIVSIIFMILG